MCDTTTDKSNIFATAQNLEIKKEIYGKKGLPSAQRE